MAATAMWTASGMQRSMAMGPHVGCIHPNTTGATPKRSVARKMVKVTTSALHSKPIKRYRQQQ